MKIKILLETIKNIHNEYIEFTFLSETKDIIEVYNNLEGVLIQKKDAKKHFLLTFEKKLTSNRTFSCIVPLREFFEIDYIGNLKLSLRLDSDIIYLNVFNYSMGNFYFTYEKKFIQVSTIDHNFPIEISIQNANDIKIFVEEICRNHKNGFTFKGKIKPIFEHKEFSVKEFYLKNAITGETIQLVDFLIDYHLNEFIINLRLGEFPLYEREWKLYCSGTFNNHNLLGLKVFYAVEKEKLSEESTQTLNEENTQTLIEENTLVGAYFNKNNNLYYHEVSSNKNKELIINIRKNTESMIYSIIDEVSISCNKLIISGMAKLDYFHTEENTINKLIFVHRETKREEFFPVVLVNSNFETQLLLEKVNFYEEKGIWDAYFGFEIYGVECREQLHLTSTESQSEEFFFLPKTIYNNFGTLRRIRAYSTADNNLAFLVRDEVIHCDVARVDYSDGMLIIKGSLYIQDVDYLLKDIYLEETETNLKLKCKNTFLNKNGIYHFESYYDWDIYKNNDFKETNFNYIIELEINTHIFKLNLVSNADDISNKANAIIFPSLDRVVDDFPLRINPYYTNHNELSVSVGNSLGAFCEEFIIRKKDIRLLMQLDLDEQYQTSEIELLFREVKTGQVFKQRPITSDSKNDQKFMFTINSTFLNSINVNFESQWDVYLSARVNNRHVETRVLGNNTVLINKNSTFKSNIQKLGQKLFFSAFFDKNNKRLSFEIRDLKAYEKNSERVRFLLARILAKVSSKFLSKPIWLIGENLGEVAQDNGFAFFEYCLKNNKPEKHYYVSTENNKNFGNLMPYKNKVLKYDSFKHLFMYCLSQYLIVSHGIRDVIPSILHNKMGINPKRVIYLQHGIIAMKKLNFNRNSYNGMIKKFVVSSQHERNILINDMNFKPAQVMVTGLSRFDSLKDQSKSKKTREILLIPTWRDWIVNSREEFLASEFYKHYNAFLQDEKLHTMLEENDLILKFFPHIEIQKKYKDDFTSSSNRIQIVELGQENMKDLIQNSSLMITDYSSVVFDFGYLEKPIIFYQFDIDDYLKHRGSYVNLREDLIGDTAYSKSQLMDYITEYISNDFTFKPKYLVKSNKYFAYRDNNNSKRIYQEIKKLSAKKSK